MHYFWNSFVDRSGNDSADHIIVRCCFMSALSHDFIVRLEFAFLFLNFFSRFEFLCLAFLRCLFCNLTLTLLMRCLSFIPMYHNITCNAAEVVDRNYVFERWDGFYDHHLNLIITTTWIPQAFLFDLITGFLEDVFETRSTSNEAIITFIFEFAFDHLSLVTCLTVFLDEYVCIFI